MAARPRIQGRAQPRRYGLPTERGSWSDPLLRAVIRSFHVATTVPMVLNTSFNVMGRPMVHDVEDIDVGVFLTSDIDVLDLEDALFREEADRPGVR
ncbi:hypothetical protein CIW48_21560 [Methylobacterium sp. P1-11]|nr:hypothetical protein CIW48_21560 [Methylobacterium sp. P1-11]